ncbi:MAG: glutathione transferase GstA [Polyangiaceae bacterium]|jgi:glutathione S-transferase|nr:glutathione transferase GstA [Polyangiaceae bacterium]
MKLYFSPGACSLASHIVAREAGLDIALEKVDLRAKKTESGQDFSAINPKGYVPALELDGGELLTEGTAIMPFLAGHAPAAKLVPEGPLGQARAQEMLGYINSEIHKSYSPLFNPQTPPEVREERIAYLRRRYSLIEQTLAGKSFLFGEQFSIADAYLFTVTSWANFLKLDLSEFPNLMAFQGRVAARPGVQAALAAEGLVNLPSVNGGASQKPHGC